MSERIKDSTRIGARMECVRKKDGRFSQYEIATKLNISQSAYSNYENEYREPPFSLVYHFCKVFDMSIDDILKVEINVE